MAAALTNCGRAPTTDTIFTGVAALFLGRAFNARRYGANRQAGRCSQFSLSATAWSTALTTRR